MVYDRTQDGFGYYYPDISESGAVNAGRFKGR